MSHNSRRCAYCGFSVKNLGGALNKHLRSCKVLIKKQPRQIPRTDEENDIFASGFLQSNASSELNGLDDHGARKNSGYHDHLSANIESFHVDKPRPEDGDLQEWEDMLEENDLRDQDDSYEEIQPDPMARVDDSWNEDDYLTESVGRAFLSIV